jgi:hypothetical protein
VFCPKGVLGVGHFLMGEVTLPPFERAHIRQHMRRVGDLELALGRRRGPEAHWRRGHQTVTRVPHRSNKPILCRGSSLTILSTFVFKSIDGLSGNARLNYHVFDF